DWANWLEVPTHGNEPYDPAFMTVNELLAVLLSLHVWQKLFFRARLGVQLQMDSLSALKITAKGASTSNYLAAEVNLMLESLQMGTMPTRHWRASINLEADALRRATTCCGRSGFKAAPGGGGTGPSSRDFVAEEANKGSGNATRTRTRSTGKDHNPKQPRKVFLEKAKKQVHPVPKAKGEEARRRLQNRAESAGPIFLLGAPPAHRWSMSRPRVPPGGGKINVGRCSMVEEFNKAAHRGGGRPRKKDRKKRTRAKRAPPDGGPGDGHEEGGDGGGPGGDSPEHPEREEMLELPVCCGCSAQGMAMHHEQNIAEATY
ncbi:unnamed protein product, partial [Effrenium voratum]